MYIITNTPPAKINAVLQHDVTIQVSDMIKQSLFTLLATKHKSNTLHLYCITQTDLDFIKHRRTSDSADATFAKLQQSNIAIIATITNKMYFAVLNANNLTN